MWTRMDISSWNVIPNNCIDNIRLNICSFNTVTVFSFMKHWRDWIKACFQWAIRHGRIQYFEQFHYKMYPLSCSELYYFGAPGVVAPLRNEKDRLGRSFCCHMMKLVDWQKVITKKKVLTERQCFWLYSSSSPAVFSQATLNDLYTKSGKKSAAGWPPLLLLIALLLLQSHHFDVKLRNLCTHLL